MQREQLGFGDFIGHPDQLFLNDLMAGDGLVAELLAELGVLEGGVVAGHGRADGSPGDAVTGLVEAHEGALDADGAGQQVGVRGTWTSCSERPLVREARRLHLPWTS